MNKTREQACADSLWGSPALFVTASFICFEIVGGSGTKLGWILYACGWLPVLGMFAWSGIKRRRPGVGGAVGVGILLVFGLLFWLNHG
ncbi:hypothetical protein ACSNOK_18115 [Streptomyces sp. URMC 126]|uniref:hypothetical protein n=1 Tax=Streptomyces sp. URMC 126 TaxID=3423401 RepID=UPI003F196274